MALNKQNARVAITGRIYKLPAGYAPITSATQPVPQGAVDLGFTNSDGVTIASERSTDSIRAWQHNVVIRNITTDSSATYDFTCVEDKQEVREMWYGSKEVNGHIEWNPSNAWRGPVLIDALDKDEDGNLFHMRHVIDDAEVSAVGDLSFISTGLTEYPITLTAYPDENGKVADVFNSQDAQNGGGDPGNGGDNGNGEGDGELDFATALAAAQTAFFFAENNVTGEVDSVSYSDQMGELTVTFTEGGESYTEDFSWQPPHSGVVQLTVVVDLDEWRVNSGEFSGVMSDILEG